MSVIVKTEAIVLRSIKFGETSKIVTFFTKELGRIAGIVKGVRKRESKFGSALDPMSHVQVVLYVKEKRDIQVVGQCDLLTSMQHVSADLEKITIGFSIIEIINKIAHEQEKNIPLFNLLQSTLAALKKFQPSPGLLLYFFELKLAELLGFTPVFDVCGHCGKSLKVDVLQPFQYFNVRKGTAICANCSGAGVECLRYSSAVFCVLNNLQHSTKIESISTISLDVKIEDEIEGFLTKFLHAHVSGFQPPRSKTIFSSVNANERKQ